MAQKDCVKVKKRGLRVVLLSVVLLLVLLYASCGVLARRAVTVGLSIACPSSGCSFRECRFNPLGYLSLKGVLLNVPGRYVFSADEVTVEYGPGLLFSGRPRRLYLGNPVLLLTGKSPGGFKLPRFMPEQLDVYSAGIRRSGDASSLALKGSLHARFSGGSLEELFVSLDRLRAGHFACAGISVYLPGEKKEGWINVEKFSFKDILLTNVRGKVWINDKKVLQALFSPVKLWDGSLGGAADVYLSAEDVKYKCRLQFKGSDLEIVSRELEFSEKVSLSGITSGEAVLEGGLSGPESITASFGNPSGGTMNIRDKKILDYLAVQSGRPLQTIYDSLKDYHYRNAVLNVSTVSKDLHVYAVFEGGQGKRMFDVRLHGMVGSEGEI